jgi:hypothetical protein
MCGIKASWMQQNSFIANLLSSQHVSGTYAHHQELKLTQMVAAYGSYHFGVQVVGLARGCNMLSGQYVCNKTILLHPVGFYSTY